MSIYDTTGMERVPFDGRSPRALTPPTRSTHAGHGPRCNSNPEIGCVCGEDERQSRASEVVAPGTIPASYVAVGDHVRLVGGTVEVMDVELLDGGETRILHRTDFDNGTHLLCLSTLAPGHHVQVVG